MGIKLDLSDLIKKGNGLTFDDVSLIPNYSEILPNEVKVRTSLTKNLPLNIPLISSAMDTVTEANLAISIAHLGGVGIIHKNMSIESQVAEVEKVKKSEFLVIRNPVTVRPEDTLDEIFSIQKSKSISSFPVVENGKLVGIITNRDLLFQENPKTKVKEIMTSDLVVAEENVSINDAKKMLRTHKLEKLPLLNKKNELVGLITMKDIRSKIDFPESNKDSKGRLIVGAAVGPKDFNRVQALAEAETDVIVLDTAHGHSKNVIEAVKKIKKDFNIKVIAGNIATKEGAEALIKAGADAVKCGVGPGSICTTRVISGVGVPQITAIFDAAQACKKAGIPLISDGGIRHSGDIVKAIAAGADSVMIGSLFAGTDESPGRTIFLNNRRYKQYRGMGSLGAMTKGSKDRYGQENVSDQAKFVPEGIEGVVPYKGKLEEVVYQLIGGLKSGMGYCGAKNIHELKKASMVKISLAGLKESHPHDVQITEESPNYSILR